MRSSAITGTRWDEFSRVEYDRAMTSLRMSIRITPLVAIVIMLIAAPPATASADGWARARRVMTDTSISSPDLMAAARDPEPAVRKSALVRIRETHDSSWESVVLERLQDHVWSVQRMACLALEDVGGPASRVPLETLILQETHPEVAARALAALGKRGDSRSWSVLESRLADPSFIVRGIAAQTAGELVDIRAADILETLAISDPTEYVRFRAGGAMERFRSGTPAEHRPTSSLVSKSQLPVIALSILVVLLAALSLLSLIRRRNGHALLSGIALAGLLTTVWLLAETSAPPRLILLRCDDVLFDAWPHRAKESSLGLCDMLAATARAQGLNVVLDTSPVAVLLKDAADTIRGQTMAPRALELMRDCRGGNGLAVVTGRDLGQEPFYYVMGLGDRGVSIVSLHRIDPVFLGEGWGDGDDLAIYRERAERLAVHEVGHMFGLPHCIRARCVMNYFETADEYFRVDAAFCAACRRRLGNPSISTMTSQQTRRVSTIRATRQASDPTRSAAISGGASEAIRPKMTAMR